MRIVDFTLQTFDRTGKPCRGGEPIQLVYGNERHNDFTLFDIIIITTVAFKRESDFVSEDKLVPSLATF